MKRHLVGETRTRARALLIRMTLALPGRCHGLGNVLSPCAHQLTERCKACAINYFMEGKPRPEVTERVLSKGGGSKPAAENLSRRALLLGGSLPPP